MMEQQTQQSVSQRQRQKQRQQNGEPERLRSRGGRRDRRRTTTAFPALHLMLIILLSSTTLRMGYCFTISQTKNKPFSPANTGKRSSAPPSEMPSTTSSSKSRKSTVRLLASKSSSSSSSTLPDIEGMKAGEMKKELESYGISTKSFFEKREFEEALKKARAEGKKPIDNNKTSSASSTSGSTSSKSKSKSASSSSKSSSSSTEKEGASRAERMKEEIEKANKMKVSELRKELKSRGIPTKSFFEKSEFVKAYAEAVVDNIGASNAKQEEEEYDASYRDVVMQKIDRASQARLLQGSPVIDIMLSK